MKKVVLGMSAFVFFCAGIAQAQGAGQFDQLRQSHWRERYWSARVETLRTKIASTPAAIDEFWREVAKEGTPLIEPSKEGNKHQLVTFLWRGTSETKSVLIVIDPFTAARPQDYLMHQLDRTDVWHLTVRMPRGARFIYRVSVNDSGAEFFGDLNLTSAVPDPLNHNNWLGHSAVELPGAPPQPWTARTPGTPEGNVERHRIASAVMSNERDVWVYTPPPRDQSTSRPNALLVLFDGLANIQLLSVPVILDNLIAASQIPATVAVFVSHPGGSRMQELGENPKFGQFLAMELLPWLRDRYKVTTDARDTIVGGQSAGGWGAAYVALHHSNVFGAVLSQSAPFWVSPELGHELAERTAATDRNDDRHIREEMEDRAVLEGNSLQKLFIGRNRLPLRFYLNAGSFEAQFWGGPGGVNGTLESNRHMRDVLRAKGYEVHYQEFIGGHDYLSWRGLLADGLIALIGKN
jgi:enterochelin esterase family protein